MSGLMAVFVALGTVAGPRPEESRAWPPPSDRAIAERARGVFAAKCAACHGPDLENPRGRFGYVLDLKRLAGNPELVVPHRPDESELWALVEHDEMPPPDSPRGPLAPEQKEILRSWIAAGAPDAPPIAPAGRLFRRMGKLHLLLLHFPIALVLAAGFGEFCSACRREPLPSDSVRFCLWIGALTAIPTAGLGWLHAASGGSPGPQGLLTAHRWLGTVAAAWLLLTAVCAERDHRRSTRGRIVRPLLTLGVLLTSFTAHLGGLLGRGQDFFTY